MSLSRLTRVYDDRTTQSVLVNLANVDAVIPTDGGAYLIWQTSGEFPRVQWKVAESLDQIELEAG